MLWPLIIAIAGFVVVAVAGAVLTDTGDWYKSLKQPSWKPADKWFGPIWTTIFVFAAIAIALGWANGTESQQMTIFVAGLVNGFLNVLWNILFFKMRRPDLALIELVVFWCSIAALMFAVGQSSMLAALMLLPYLVWVAIAGVLNRAIVNLNQA